MTFVQDFADTIYKARLTDAPELYTKACGYHLISALLGRYFICPYTRRIGGLKPNIWFLLSSIPARTRRTSVNDIDEYIYMETLKKFGLTEEDINTTMIEEGTPEGIGDFIEASTSNLSYVIRNDEIGGVLKRTRGGQYEYGLPILLSRLYDGKGWTQLLSTRSGKKARQIPKNLYVTMFAGMQEPKEYLDKEMIRQGLLRRIMLCYLPGQNIDKDRWLSPIGTDIVDFEGTLEPFISKLKELTEKYDDIYTDTARPIGVVFMDNIIDNIKNIAKHYDDKLCVEKPQDIDIYEQSIWERLTKITMLEAISRGNIDVSPDGDHNLRVTIEDFLNAKKFVDEINETNELIMEQILKSKPATTHKEPIERIYEIIARTGNISRSNLMRNSGMLAEDLDKIITTLKGQDRIEMEIIPREHGKDAIFYKLKSND